MHVYVFTSTRKMNQAAEIDYDSPVAIQLPLDISNTMVVESCLNSAKSNNWTEINFKCLSAANDPALFYLIRKFFPENSISIFVVRSS